MKKYLRLLLVFVTFSVQAFDIGLYSRKNLKDTISPEITKISPKMVMVYHLARDVESIKKLGLLTNEQCHARDWKGTPLGMPEGGDPDQHKLCYFRPIIYRHTHDDDDDMSKRYKGYVAYKVPETIFVYSSKYRLPPDMEKYYKQKLPLSLLLKMYDQGWSKREQKIKFEDLYEDTKKQLDTWCLKQKIKKDMFLEEFGEEVIIKPENGCIPPEKLYFWDKKTKQWIQGYNQPEID